MPYFTILNGKKMHNTILRYWLSMNIMFLERPIEFI